jgi:hypothetical protein
MRNAELRAEDRSQMRDDGRQRDIEFGMWNAEGGRGNVEGGMIEHGAWRIGHRA